jgi:D-3-phosphoglycerate dehydrogenase
MESLICDTRHPSLEAFMKVLRWGRSAYETDEGIARERAHALAIGAKWRLETDARSIPAHQADALVVTSGVRVDANAVSTIGCKLVLTTTSGTDHIDLAACKRQGVTVARSPVARRDAVVEHTIASMLWLRRRLGDLNHATQQNSWARADLPVLAPQGLRNARVAVIGLGVIGTRVAETLDALGASVLCVDPAGVPQGRRSYSLDDAITQSDIITLHCGLTPQTRGMFNRFRLADIPHHTVLINTARGTILDVAAAVQQVKRGHLGGLAVDVFPEEPYPLLETLHHPRILATPHASGYTADLCTRVADEVGNSLVAWANGTGLPHQIT